MPDRWLAIYCRISLDRTGRREGVGDQERLGREYWSRHSPGVRVEVYSDNDIAASGASLARPDFDRLRDDVEAGHVIGLWTIEQSRLTRREVEWFELALLLEEGGITEVHTQHDGVLDVEGEVAGFKAIMSAKEVRRLSKRVKVRQRSLAAQGRPGGGKSWGYVAGRNDAGEATKEVDPKGAESLRLAAAYVLAGWSMANIARSLNEAGYLSPYGKPIRPTGLRSALMSPTTAGLRVHLGKVVGKATWQPILDEGTWRAVVARLTAPDLEVERADGKGTMRVPRSRKPARRYLLTGFLICGRDGCGKPLVAQRRWTRAQRAQPREVRGEGYPYYACHPKNGGCSGLGILGEATEDHVVEALLSRLERPDYLAALARDDHEHRRAALGGELATIEGRHVDLATRWAAGTLPAAAWDAARARLEADRSRLLAELAEVPPPPGDMIDPAVVREAWAGEMTLDEQRALMSLHISHVVVRPATPGVTVFDPGRLTIHWRRTR